MCRVLLNWLEAQSAVSADKYVDMMEVFRQTVMSSVSLIMVTASFRDNSGTSFKLAIRLLFCDILMSFIV